ncbi:MAG: DNA-binding response regulator [Oscillatoriales cyanobacterium]|uniref:Response regulator transcription factor n=1 Tax=Microcoleus anatoxicus PTRS2 TaxID=2705321 RepID=A0ABU8YJ71_9CYAN|nr:MAG: DNA-binding response regulator [Oscillatoriales cyanobacterium]TAD98735.1 MAG: DNA-binding response regulator [Oscillatoriales cyanobacterium]TAE06989.1 MAG: DNA-binding response regulator [Oscillatoriales cyanobacterium]TAF04979.1 MAG: DNA-binding response regulator [Oscillatoriales cyanobacterium]TAF47419.1 MAG: DNA-binding response regulator [Oscillatoriales cyanobacterium]
MKILLVEDDRAIAALLCQTLTSHRYAVDLASDGQLALELLMQWDYDLILLDVLIPKQDGISLGRQLRCQGNQTPILMLTAQNSNENIITGLDAGADDYVIKPFNPHQLFLRHPQRIFSRNAIIDRLWSSDQSPTEAAVTTLIKDLRSRLKATGITEKVIEIA